MLLDDRCRPPPISESEETQSALDGCNIGRYLHKRPTVAAVVTGGGGGVAAQSVRWRLPLTFVDLNTNLMNSLDSPKNAKWSSRRAGRRALSVS